MSSRAGTPRMRLPVRIANLVDVVRVHQLESTDTGEIGKDVVIPFPPVVAPDFVRRGVPLLDAAEGLVRAPRCLHIDPSPIRPPPGLLDSTALPEVAVGVRDAPVEPLSDLVSGVSGEGSRAAQNRVRKFRLAGHTEILAVRRHFPGLGDQGKRGRSRGRAAELVMPPKYPASVVRSDVRRLSLRATVLARSAIVKAALRRTVRPSTSR